MSNKERKGVLVVMSGIAGLLIGYLGYVLFRLFLHSLGSAEAEWKIHLFSAIIGVMITAGAWSIVYGIPAGVKRKTKFLDENNDLLEPRLQTKERDYRELLD